MNHNLSKPTILNLHWHLSDRAVMCWAHKKTFTQTCGCYFSFTSASFTSLRPLRVHHRAQKNLTHNNTTPFIVLLINQQRTNQHTHFDDFNQSTCHITGHAPNTLNHQSSCQYKYNHHRKHQPQANAACQQ